MAGVLAAAKDAFPKSPNPRSLELAFWSYCSQILGAGDGNRTYRPTRLSYLIDKLMVVTCRPLPSKSDVTFPAGWRCRSPTTWPQISRVVRALAWRSCRWTTYGVAPAPRRSALQRLPC